jgi:hypothetical protein
MRRFIGPASRRLRRLGLSGRAENRDEIGEGDPLMLSSSKHGAGFFSSLLEEALIPPMCRMHDGHRIRAQEIGLHTQFTRELVRTRHISGVSGCCGRLHKPGALAVIDVRSVERQNSLRPLPRIVSRS